MKFLELDTPALLIDRERLMKNLADMQRYAEENGVKLRPHTKTHKTPEIAKMQLRQGACGIAVAKTGADTKRRPCLLRRGYAVSGDGGGAGLCGGKRDRSGSCRDRGRREPLRHH